MQTEIETKVVAELSKMTKNKVHATSLIQNLGIDSLDLIQAVTKLEKEYNIFFTDEELLSIKTVSDITTKIIDKKSR
ncbi:acyl carrier protein [[Mycoplasma] gypis]|uniref:Acyl carrier protein n=1 Tax=[Mycoplasma] gypis TaxID=92404 RepID=A0ABZ2RRA8_9BACT|nr:acyl carrier protein [[Mycoplasma] gypis]MBN0919313.1 acyl carrier protein [[Mycoplasma] gypis]